MQAVVITKPGGPEVLETREVLDPVPGPDDVLVAVTATAVNRADLLQREGRYPAPPDAPADIPGLEAAGVVAGVGARVREWTTGDRVMALLPGGGYAELVVVPAGMLMAVPDGLDLTQAAAIPEVFLTAFDALFARCGLQPGESALVHAAGSGVGTAAIQLASLAGCRTFGTAGSQDKLDRAAALGLDVGIHHGEQDFAAVVREETAGRGVDVVLDVVGGPYWDRNLASLATRGRMAVVGILGGRSVPNVNLGALMGKRLSVHGTVLRARPLHEKVALTREFSRRMLPHLASGALRPVVDTVFALDRAADAHRHMEARRNFGKIVLRVRAGG